MVTRSCDRNGYILSQKTVDIFTECREMFRNFGLRDGVTTATAATFHISLQYYSDKGLKAMLLQIIRIASQSCHGKVCNCM